MVRPAHPSPIHDTAVIPHSFEVFYAATVLRTLAATMRETGEREIARSATQGAYAVMLSQWSDRQARAIRDSARSVVSLAVHTAADLHPQGRTAVSEIDDCDDCAEQRDDNETEPYWFDIRDGLRELVLRTDPPSPPLPHMVTSALVIDDHPMWRRTIAARLIQLGTGTVQAVATAAEAREHAVATGPRELAIIDPRLPDGDGIDLITELRRHGWPRIVVLTPSNDPDTVRAALHAGAQAYLRKPTHPLMTDDTAHTLDDVHADPSIAPILAIAALVSSPDSTPYDLSAREVEILQLVAGGQSNKQIARTLDLAASTVKSHLSRIARKLGPGDRAQLVAIAMRAGIIH